MSALAGIWWWDGQPVAAGTIAALAERSRAAGPDGGGTVQPLPGLALQAHILHFDRHSAMERQPHAFGAGSFVTWDGRLDNRDDLFIALDSQLEEHPTDVAIVAAAYTRWGESCFQRLVGDWSLALWDGPRQTLLLARDCMGNRSLYYRETANGLAWATRLDALAAAFDLYGQPDDEYIALRLHGAMPVGLAPFKGIRTLRAGHTLLATKERQTQVRRYWTFEPRALRYRKPEDYHDHLRMLLTEAVRVRLRTHRPVWAHLSGGWDSSAIVCLANTLIKRSVVAAPSIRPVSMVFGRDPEPDESVFIDSVERWCNRRSTRVEFPGKPTLAELEALEHRAPRETSEFLLECLEAPMRAAGDHVILGGALGDTTMMRGASSRIALLEPLLEGHPLKWLHICWARARFKRTPFHTVLWHSAGQAWRTTIPRRRRRNPRPADGSFLRAIRISCPEGPDMYPGSVNAFSMVKRYLVQGYYDAAESGEISNHESAPTACRAYPFAHRPLLEFLLAVPHLALWAPDADRAGMKSALMGALPSEVLARRTKGSPEAAWIRIRREHNSQPTAYGASGGRVDDWELVKRGHLDREAMSESLRRLTAHDGRGPSPFPEEWLHLEAWLRNLSASRCRASGLAPSEESSRAVLPRSSGDNAANMLVTRTSH